MINGAASTDKTFIHSFMEIGQLVLMLLQGRRDTHEHKPSHGKKKVALQLSEKNKFS
jgi:hypothetical protein